MLNSSKYWDMINKVKLQLREKLNNLSKFKGFKI